MIPHAAAARDEQRAQPWLLDRAGHRLPRSVDEPQGFRREGVAFVTRTCHAFDVVEDLLIRVSRMRGSDVHIVDVPKCFYEWPERGNRR